MKTTAKFLLTIVSLLVLTSVFAQESYPLIGKVVDGETGKPLSNTVITIENSSVVTQSDSNGSFQMTLPSKDALLTFARPEYKPLAVLLSLKKNKEISLVTMLRPIDTPVGDETAYARGQSILGNGDWADFTFAHENLEKMVTGSNNINELLIKIAASTPGLLFNQNTDGPALQFLRSANENSNTSATIVLNNVVMANSMLGSLVPAEVARIEVYRPGSPALNVMGTLALHGVINIYTKSGASTRTNLASR